MTEQIATIVMLAMLAAAVATDLHKGKIYNWLTAPCAAAGLALGLASGGMAGLADRLLGAAAALAVVLLVFHLARLGGGDIKLLLAVGALGGLHFVLWAMLLTGLSGGLLAAVYILRRRAAKQTALNIITNMLSNAGALRIESAAASAVGKIPYSLAIALGSVAALALKVVM